MISMLSFEAFTASEFLELVKPFGSQAKERKETRNPSDQPHQCLHFLNVKDP